MVPATAACGVRDGETASRGAAVCDIHRFIGGGGADGCLGGAVGAATVGAGAVCPGAAVAAFGVAARGVSGGVCASGLEGVVESYLSREREVWSVDGSRLATRQEWRQRRPLTRHEINARESKIEAAKRATKRLVDITKQENACKMLIARVGRLRYAIELLSTDQEIPLSELEDLASEVSEIERTELNGRVDAVPVRKRSSSSLSKPCDAESMAEQTGVTTRKLRRDALASRISRVLDRSIEDQTDNLNAMGRLLDESIREQLESRDAVSDCQPTVMPERNPLCTTPSENALANMVPTHHEATREMVYLMTDKRTVDALCGDSGGCDEIHTETLRLNYQREKGGKYISLAAQIELGSRVDDVTAKLRAIVDSGAAYSAIRFDELKHLFPECAKSMDAVEGFNFVDASDNKLPLLGSVELRLCLGDFCFWTRVFVFRTLGVPFLLGVNSMVDGDLVINVKRGQLYHAGDSTLGVCTACSQGELQRLNFCGSAHACDCDKHADPAPVDPVSVIADLGSKEVRFCVNDTIFTVPCSEEVSSHPILELDATRDGIPMRTMDKVRVPAANGRRPGVAHVRLEYKEWIAGEEVGVGIRACPKFIQQTGLTVVDQRNSSMNAHAFLPLINYTDKEIEIEPETLVGYAEPGSANETVTCEPLQGQEQASQRVLLAYQVESYEELAAKPFSEGGPPVTAEDFDELGLDLSKCIHPGRRRPDGSYEPLPEEYKERIRKIASRWWLAWCRDARAPQISHLVVIDIPTGDAQPITQKPYPIAERYKKAMREEIQKLLDAGLIEPGISDWASPTLLTVKKDSTTDKLKVKVVVDYRKLNEVTIPDGGLGVKVGVELTTSGTVRWVVCLIHTPESR